MVIPWRDSFHDANDARRSASPPVMPVTDEQVERSRADQAESVFTWGVFAYSVLRVIPVWGALRDGSVNPWIFLFIDVSTAYPYAKSWPRLFRSLWGKRYQAAVFWLLVLLGTFLAPYLYVAIAGDDVATWVWWLLGLFVLIGVIGAVVRVRKALQEREGSDAT